MFRKNPGRIYGGGFFLLFGLLIVAVIGVYAYYARLQGPVYEIGVGESDIKPPWRQWHKMDVRFKRGETVGQPDEDQPKIEKTLYVHVDCLNHMDKKCGKVLFSFDPDGTIRGGWSAEFYLSKDIHFQVMTCDFEGNIDPKIIYFDEEGESDYSWLFFITKGHFSILETNNDTGIVRNVMGEAYLRGWMKPDYNVEGDLVITSDMKNFYRYTFKGRAEEEIIFDIY